MNIVIQRSPDSLFFYDPVAHALGTFENPSTLASELFAHAMAVIPSPSATIFWFAGDQTLINSYYNSGESLLWRDSGALAATIALVAEALGLGACFLGVSGNPFLSKIFREQLTGFGALLVGEK